MLTQEELDFVTKISSVSLHSLNKDCTPIATASGCLIRYKGAKFLLTVSHAILEPGRWAIQLEYDFEKQGIKYYCPIFQWFTQGKIKLDQKDLSQPIENMIEDPRTIDVAYARIPDDIQPVDEYFDFEKGIKYFAPKKIIETNLLDVPDTTSKYSFYGDVRTSVYEKQKAILINPKLQKNVKFVCDFKDDYYRFQLPEIIKDKYDYKGCSGAPIIDENGTLVSLVTNGAENTNILLGINFKKLKVALDCELNNFD